MLLYSKRIIRSPRLLNMKNNVYVLGNGHSLKQLVNENVNFLSLQNLVVVNDFFFNENFSSLKPGVYLIADPAYWASDVADDMLVLRKKMQNTLLNIVNWDMLFFVPTSVYVTGIFQKIYQANPYITLQPYNDASFIGTKRLRYFFYDRLLAKPLSGNVIGSALYIALQMDIKEIFLFGVEHSWTLSLFVDDQNRTCIRNDHFYANDHEAKVWLKSNAQPYAIQEALFDIATMLSGYRDINDYAIYKNVKIYNCTPNSFIDAFERKIQRPDEKLP